MNPAVPETVLFVIEREFIVQVEDKDARRS
jgi:hypothetical protein